MADPALLGAAAGLAKGWFGGKSYASANDRAERKLGIYESQESRTQKQFEDMQAAQEHFKTRPNYGGEGGQQTEGVWDELADDPQYDGFRKDFEEFENMRRALDPTGRGKGEQVGPMSLTKAEAHRRGRDTSKDAYFQAILDRGITQYNTLPEEPAAETLPPLSEPSGEGGGGEGGGGGDPALRGAPEGAGGAIPVPETQKTSNVESAAWNKIGHTGGDGRDVMPRAFAAEGGPVTVLPRYFMGGLASMGGGAGVQPAAPTGGNSWMDRLRATRATNRDAGMREFDFGYDPGNTTASQNTGPGMQLRGAPPVGGQIPVPGQGQGQGLQTSTPGLLPAQQWGRAAEGGPIHVLPKFQAGGQPIVPAQAAAPPPQPAAPPPQEGIPTGDPQAQPPQQQQQQQWRPENDYRARHAAWQREGENMWMQAGGLEGLTKFRDMSNAASRRQILGYGQQAVRALNEGSIGEAMRAANTALEHTPFNTGLKFVAENGELFMQGPDGKRGTKVGAPELMAYIEDNMKTPETYLDWKKQYETERSGKAGEKLRGREASVSERRMTLDEELEPQDTASKSLTALASYNNSLANQERAMRTAMAAAEGGWDANNALAIGRDSEKWVLENFDPLHEDIGEYFKDQPLAWEDFKHDVTELQLYNPWNEQTQKGSVDRTLASIVSQLIRQPGGISEGELGLKEGDFQISEHPDQPGELIANYKGQLIALPKVMHGDAMNHSAFVESPQGGSKQAPGATTPPADPAAALTPPPAEAIDTGGGNDNWMAPTDPQVRQMLEQQGIDPETGKRPVDYSNVPFVRKVMPDSALGK